MSIVDNALLKKIGQVLDNTSSFQERQAIVAARLRNPVIYTRPQLFPTSTSIESVGEVLVTRFSRQLTKVAGTINIVDNMEQIVPAIIEFFNAHQQPLQAVADRGLSDIIWPKEMSVSYRAAQDQDKVSISLAFAGVAETGSIVMLSSADSPTTLNFMPDYQIVILRRVDLLGHIEEVWARLRQQAMPRTVNFITGPSRTADIEQTIQLGAHGPRQLHVILCYS